MSGTRNSSKQARHSTATVIVKNIDNIQAQNGRALRNENHRIKWDKATFIHKGKDRINRELNESVSTTATKQDVRQPSWVEVPHGAASV
jgi:hypothetical protein